MIVFGRVISALSIRNTRRDDVTHDRRIPSSTNFSQKVTRSKFIGRTTKIKAIPVQTLHYQIQTTGQNNSKHTYIKTPTPSNDEAKERVQPCLYSPSWSSWNFIWWTLPLVLHFTYTEGGRSRVRFLMSSQFFIDIILPAALWLWGWLSLNRNEYQEYCLGVKAVGAYGLPPSHADCLGITEASTSWNPQGLCRPVMGLLYLYLSSRPLCYECECSSHIQLSFQKQEMCRQLKINLQNVGIFRTKPVATD